MAPQPMRWLFWLLRLVSSRDAADAAVGDVLDELAERTRAARPPRWPRLWINLQVIKVLPLLAASMMPRLGRSGWHVLRDAVRSLRSSPAYAVLVIALLAVGIAAGTITYSVVDAVVLRPLAIAGGDRLVTVSRHDDGRTPRISVDAFREIHARVTSFESVARLFIADGAIVTIGGIEDEITELHATSELFRVLGFTPAIGRLWTAGDEARGETDVAVLGYRYWMGHFGGDPDVIGETVVSGNATYQVIGVLAPDTDVPGVRYSESAVWVPIAPDSDAQFFGIVGRMRPGVSAARLADEIQAVIGTADWRPDVVPLLETYVEQVEGWMLLALGAAGLVVLIACVNAANIMLTRTVRRTHELTIRSSIGASRLRIALSVVTEGLVLSIAASACALLFAVWGISAAKLAVTTHLMGTFRASTIGLNGRVFVAAVTAAVITGVLASLVPAWQASRTSVLGVLKDAAPSVTGGGRSWRTGLLVTETACVTVLLVVASLFATSLIRAVNIDLGVDPTQLLAVSPRLEFNGTVEDVRQRVESLPGVTGVAVTRGGTSLPLIGRVFGGAWGTTSLQRTDATGDAPAIQAFEYRVTSNYFGVAGIRFRRGGTWPADAASGTPWVVLDERVAAQMFGDADPLGRQIRSSRPEGVFTVVGVVPYVYIWGPEEEVEPAAYFAWNPESTRTFGALFVKTSRPVDEMVPLVTEAIGALAPDGKRPYVFAAHTAVRQLTATRRFTGGLMSIFGGLAMLFGAAGIYGVTAAVVAQQTREIGVRVALGATPRRIGRGVLARTGAQALTGLAMGLPLAWWISRGFSAYLFQVTPADPPVYASVAMLVGLVAFASALLPARRAARTDPMITLRG